MFTLGFYQLVALLRSLYCCALGGTAGDLAFWAARLALIGDCGEGSAPTRSRGARDLGCGFEVGVLLGPLAPQSAGRSSLVAWWLHQVGCATSVGGPVATRTL
jgi:hypothetical protein